MTTTHSPFPAMGHQIPFRQPAVTVPLTWAFGAPPQAFAPPCGTIPRKDSLSPVASSSRSRKRCASEEMTNDEPLPLTRQPAALPKRVRRACLPPDADMAAGGAAKADETDLGKAFASLTKPELITLLHDLLNQKPELKAPIAALLPPPTLESIVARLQEIEVGLLELIPNKRMNREEYVWNRVRVPLNGYVNDCLGWLRLASQARECAEAPLQRTHSPHSVSEQFTLLSTLSSSIKKVEDQLPVPAGPADDLNSAAAHPLQSVLIPSLFENWKGFVETIYRMVFFQGTILSESLIRKWFSQLDELATGPAPEAGNVQQLMVVIRDEARVRFGDLVGLRNLRGLSWSQQNLGRTNQTVFEEMF